MNRKASSFKEREMIFANANVGPFYRILRPNLLRTILFIILKHVHHLKRECGIRTLKSLFYHMLFILYWKILYLNM